MEEYKPKRLEFHNYIKYGVSRTVGLNIAKERYGKVVDYYLSIHLWFIGLTIVFIRVMKQ